MVRRGAAFKCKPASKNSSRRLTPTLASQGYDYSRWRLRVTTRHDSESWAGRRSSTPDPRMASPYFGGAGQWSHRVTVRAQTRSNDVSEFGPGSTQGFKLAAHGVTWGAKCCPTGRTDARNAVAPDAGGAPAVAAAPELSQASLLGSRGSGRPARPWAAASPRPPAAAAPNSALAWWLLSWGSMSAACPRSPHPPAAGEGEEGVLKSRATAPPAKKGVGPCGRGNLR